MNLNYWHIWPVPEWLTPDEAEADARRQLAAIAAEHGLIFENVELNHYDDGNTTGDDGDPWDGPVLVARADAHRTQGAA
jgi:hypothetical protein